MQILEPNSLVDKVGSGETILTKYLNGSTKTVVVTDTEPASLNYSYVQDAGVTLVDNSTAKLSWSTTLDMIGQSYKIWTVGNTVVYYEDAGNTVWGTDAYTKGISDKDAGMKLANAAQFVNFGEGTTYTSSDYKIKYVAEVTDTTITTALQALDNKVAASALTVDGNTWTRVIKAGEEVTATDLTVLKLIFNNADKIDENGYVTGEVYIGTQSLKDVSDIESYKSFVNNYLSATQEDDNAKANENGNYIKVIDNDGDGYADYILKTTYTMDVITNIAGNGTVTLAGTEANGTVPVAADSLVTEDELAAGDVVVYALIDGVYYVNQAEIVTDTIDKKGIDFKTETLTCGDNTYTQSRIGIDAKAFNAAFAYDTFKTEVTDAEVEVTYDFYLDNYGYVRAYTTNKSVNGLGLLTDAYYYTDKKTSESKVDLVTSETEETEYAVSKDAGSFIMKNTDTLTNLSDNGTWGRLNGFVDTDELGNTVTGAHTFKTNVAAYSLADDAVVLKNATKYAATNNKVIQEELNLSAVSGLTLKNRTYTALEGQTIRATTDTVYYYVTTTFTGDLAVQSWVGYNNAPSTLTFDAADDFAYAIATGTKTTGASNALYYYYADVIVIEAKSADSNVHFGYYSNTKTNVAQSFWLWSIGLGEVDGEAAYTTTQQMVERADVNTLQNVPAFYKLKNGVATLIVSETDTTATSTEYYTANGIYAGIAAVGVDVRDRNYVEVYGVNNDAAFTANKTVSTSFYTDDVPVYKVSVGDNTNSYLNYSVSACAPTTGDKLIYVVENKAVAYAIDVTQSTSGRPATVIPAVEALFEAIVADNNLDRTAAATVTFYGVATKNGADKEVSYKTASTFEGTNLVIENAQSYKVYQGSKEVTDLTTIKPSKDADAVYTVTLVNKKGEIESYTLTQKAQVAVTGKLEVKTAYSSLLTINAQSDTAAEINADNTGADKLTLTDLQNGLASTVSGETVTVKGYSAKDTELSMNESLANVSYVIATITNTDGDSKTVKVTVTNDGSTGTAKYVLTQGSTSKFVATGSQEITSTGFFTAQAADGKYWGGSSFDQTEPTYYATGTNITMPAQNVTIVDGYYSVTGTGITGTIYKKSGETVTATGLTQSGIVYKYNATSGTAAVTSGTATFTMPAYNVTVADAVKITVDGGTPVYAEKGKDYTLTGLTGDYYTANAGSSYVGVATTTLSSVAADTVVTSGYYKVEVVTPSFANGNASNSTVTIGSNAPVSIASTGTTTAVYVTSGTQVTITAGSGARFSVLGHILANGETYEETVTGSVTYTLVDVDAA
jgi:hypothetical protein